MADKTMKVEGNVDGAYYVDSDCIACGLCVNEAPDSFTMNDGEEYALVYKQPENDAERQLCEDSLDQCPVEAIGKDG